LREAVREQPVVHRHLAAYGLLKFFDCPLIWSQEFLLQFLFVCGALTCSALWYGGKLTFSTTEDIYFLTGLPFWGRELVIDPHLLGEDRVETIVMRHCSGLNPMSGSVVRIEALDDLLTECIEAMVVRIYGSLGTQWITGGKLRVVEEVLDGDLFVGCVDADPDGVPAEPVSAC
jgi:hypothetical protein